MTAGKEISQLDPASTLSGGEIVPIDQAGRTVKATTQDIANLAALSVPAGAVPTGGTTGQVLTKLSGANYDDGWSDAIDTSVVTDAVLTETDRAITAEVILEDAILTETARAIAAETGGGTWGSITGTLSAQTDLNSALGAKAPLASPTFTGTVAGITKTMVGLGSVDNTADTAKPVSTAQQTALNLKANLASPTFTGTVTIPTGASITAPTGIVKGDVGLGNVDNTSNTTERAATATLTNKTLTSPAITTPTGIVKGDVGLGNVDNTSDANKPVSTAATTALAGKAQALTRTAVKTANYAAAAGDLVPCDTTSGAFTVTLPTAPATKSRVAVKHIIQGGTNAVTYACGGSDTLNKVSGVTSGSLIILAQSVILEYDAGTAVWSIVSGDTPVGQLDLRFAPITGIAESAVTNLTTDLGTLTTNVSTNTTAIATKASVGLSYAMAVNAFTP